MTARRDPLSPDDPGAPRPRSGPADVPVALLVAARDGDPGAFARFVEHWDPHVRPFVHHTLAGDGPTDPVLAAAYVRAFRALPRYRADHTPGLWLHRIAYLAAVDELRRLTRDPTRRRHRAHALPAPVASDQPATDPHDLVAGALRRLAPDQRALAVLVDLEGFDPDTVADAFGTGRGAVASRLGSARQVLDRAADPGAADPDAAGPGAAGPGATTDDPATTPPGADRSAAPTADRPGPPRPGPAGPRADPAGVLGGPLVAGSPDAPPAPTTTRAARPGRAGAVTTRRAGATPPATPPPGATEGPADDLAVPSWFADEAVTLLPASDPAEPGPAGDAATTPGVPEGAGDADADADAERRRPERVGRALAALPVPPPGPGFWTDLGTRLLAERERPAAPTPDPVARLARAHPARPGFSPAPAPGTAPAAPAVSTLADRAGRARPRRSWLRPVAVLALVLLLAGVVTAAVRFGTSSPVRDGSVTGTALAATVADGFGASRFLTVDVVVEQPGQPGDEAEQEYRVVLGDDGSWSASRTDVLQQSTADAGSGTVRRVAILPGADGGPPVVLATVQEGLAAGAPDPRAVADGPVAELQALGTILRGAGDERAPATRTAGVRTWTLDRSLATGPGGDQERWAIAVRRTDGLPARIDRHVDGELVRRLRFRSWTPASTVPPETFVAGVPAGTTPTTTAHGFLPADLAAARIFGRGEAIRPGSLPDGFELAAVSIRAEAPAGAVSTGGGTNPPDVAVVSLGYQRGPERITVTTRATTAPASDWTDPFVEAAADGPAGGTSPDRRRTLGDGRFNQVAVHVTADGFGRARLWGVDGDTVFTVSGDLTPSEAFAVASSLR